MPQPYDVTLKLLLRDPLQRAVDAAIGLSIKEWLDVELPLVQNPRMDLLGKTADGALLHLELQVGPDPEMPQRMAQYALGILRLYDKFARQVVLYAGDSNPGMSTSLKGDRFSFEYELINLRDLDGEALLGSEVVSDNVLAILTKLRNREAAVKEIVRKVFLVSEQTERDVALRQLMILAGLRGLEEFVEKEIQKMPTYHELVLNNKVLGREYNRGLAEGELIGELKGKLQGELEGKREGKREGELEVVRRLIQRRFGPIPGWAQDRLAEKSLADIESLSDRLLDSASLDDLLH